MSPKTVPDGHHTVTPYLVVTDVARTIECLTKAFDAVEVERLDDPLATRREDVLPEEMRRRMAAMRA